MFDVYNSSGFDLYQPFPDLDQWVIDTKFNHAMHGTLKEVCKLMVEKLGFEMDDILDGLKMIADNVERGDNCCHFGIYKSPIYSNKKEVSHERAS